MLVSLFDGGDVGGRGHAEMLDLRCSSATKARPRKANAMLKGVMGVVSHLSEATGVETHVGYCGRC